MSRSSVEAAAGWSAGGRRHNLPLEMTSFIGREQEIAEVGRQLATTRLLTLTGAGGVGKTRLALRVATDHLNAYPDGAWLVELAALTDPSVVPYEVAWSLGLREIRGDPVEALLGYLRPRSLLLVLDNCEHLVDPCATLAETLLRGSPGLRMLATSREPLRIPGETAWRVPSLSRPDPQHLPPFEHLQHYEAVRLFVERTRSVCSEFTLTEQNAPAVAQICEQLDGIPLALELAAARMKVLSVEQIANRLDDRFLLLTGGPRTALPRHQTLRATIEWSVDLLSDAERVLLRRLAIFVGGWTLEDAEAVCAGDGIEASQILDLLSMLVDKSLVLVEGNARAAPWYRLLETVRQYAAEALRQANEENAIGRRHVERSLRYAEEAEPGIESREQREWLARLEAQHDNLRAALAWCERMAARPSTTGQAATWASVVGLRIAGSLRWFWWHHGHFREGRRWLASLLEAAETVWSATNPSTDFPLADSALRARAKALIAAGQLARGQGDYERAMPLLEEGLALARSLGDHSEIASALIQFVAVASDQGDYDRATRHCQEALAACREAGNAWLASLALYWMGFLLRARGDDEHATEFQEESLSIRRQQGDTWGIAWSLHNLGMIAENRGDHRRAIALLEESLSLHRELEHQRGIAWVLADLGLVAHVRGSDERSLALLTESLRLERDLGERWGIAKCLERLAGVAVGLGSSEQGARLFGAAQALRAAMSAWEPAERTAYERDVATARGILGDAAFDRARSEGYALSVEAAVAEALTIGARRPLPISATTPAPSRQVETDVASLTPRERDVLGLIAAGRSTKEIAAALVVSVPTVERHITHIYQKIGARGRADATAYALRHGLT
jgi:predicted ATPase/DNA-binding CsgD family transcriptional regulator